MHSFWGFVRKEFLHILRDRRTLLILFGMPLVQMFLFGFAIRTEVEDIPIAVVDLANDPVTRSVQQALVASGHFEIVAKLPSTGALEGTLVSGGVRQALVFPADFSAQLRRGEAVPVQIVTDGTDPNTARTMLFYATAVLQQTAANPQARPVGVMPLVRMQYNPELKSAYYFVPGLMAFVLLIVCALMTSVTIAREKEQGTMEVLLVSPLRPLQVILGKVVPYLVLAFADAVLIIVLAATVFGVPVRGSVFLLLTESLLYIVCGLALGVLISARATTQQAATLGAMAGLMFPTLILSGFLFPLESLPGWLQPFSAVIPARWFLEIVKGIMLKGNGFDVLWQETLILAAITLVLLAASVRQLKARLE